MHVPEKADRGDLCCVSPMKGVRTELQGDDKAFIVLAEEAVQVLYEAELWPVQLVGFHRILQRLRLYSISDLRQQPRQASDDELTEVSR